MKLGRNETKHKPQNPHVNHRRLGRNILQIISDI